jgi:bifunctional ADP-heptose synthase (sugar kinase/adenylyltransferase)
MELSKELGDELIVIVNNDKQAELKRGVPSFQEEQFRMTIVKALKPVDRVMLSIDTDGGVIESLRALFKELRADDSVGRIIFAKGGDRNTGNIPEKPVCDEYQVEIIDGMGAKTHNSSDFVKHQKAL